MQKEQRIFDHSKGLVTLTVAAAPRPAFTRPTLGHAGNFPFIGELFPWAVINTYPAPPGDQTQSRKNVNLSTSSLKKAGYYPQIKVPSRGHLHSPSFSRPNYVFPSYFYIALRAKKVQLTSREQAFSLHSRMHKIPVLAPRDPNVLLGGPRSASVASVQEITLFDLIILNLLASHYSKLQLSHTESPKSLHLN